MTSGLRTRLSIMMFLEFFIWGAWLPVSFSYFGEGGLNFHAWQRDLINIAFPVSAILAMFFANQFVDRNFAAERFLAISHIIGGFAIMALAWTTEFWTFFVLMAVHCLFYVPTISVTNTIAFANLKDAQKDFGPIRLWGTIGWIAAAWPFIFLLVDWNKAPSMQDAGGFVNWLGAVLDSKMALSGEALNTAKSWAFLVAGIASLVLGGFSLLLPHTPPKPATSTGNQFAWLEAARLLKHPYMLVLFIVTFIDATVHDGYFFFAFDYLGHVGVPANWIAPAMSVGQIAEIATMALLGLVLKNLGWRYTMTIGVLGHCLRFAVFALVPYPAAAVAVNVLHGVCYAFFFATLYIFVDEYFPKDARTSAQGLFNFLILGLSQIASRIVWQRVKEMFTTGEGPNAEIAYPYLLLVPSATALAAALLLFFCFHPPAKPVPENADR